MTGATGARGRPPLAQVVRDFLYGMSGYEFDREAMEERASMESLFMLITMGDIIGVPVLPPYYSLRLLPYVVPEVDAWKRRTLRERLFGEHHVHHLHGM